ncbi:hypothetical protein CTAYLR_008641 [Chrysophaeum taylorii]|uniref:PPM-type phosphatase domain-containing protein n=1 Tax=Chrysophaeum taylorii TaxID=2483200 RepID=A0AAD7U6M6_9STRA|nr:hypothetical protein CTAYLR_008641 [Chrysophaeum taylorii]
MMQQQPRKRALSLGADPIMNMPHELGGALEDAGELPTSPVLRWSSSSVSSSFSVESPAKRAQVSFDESRPSGASTVELGEQRLSCSSLPEQSTVAAPEQQRQRMVRWWIGRAESCGLKRCQEDRHAIVDLKDAVYCAVFDGHNGTRAAEHARLTLHRHLLEEGAVDRAAWCRAFASCDAELVASGVVDGSTALAALVERSALTVANCGDSRAVLGSGHRSVRLTCDHKPDVASEKARIEAAGGQVAFRGVWRLAVADCPVMLAVSRALGDRQLKTLAAPRNEVLSATPDICDRTLTRNDHFLILATDGLWDALSDQEAVDCVYDVLGDAIKTGRLSEGIIDIAAAALIARATSLRSFDNITAIIVVFQWTAPPARPTARTASASAYRSSRSKKAAGTRASNFATSNYRKLAR